MADEMRYQQAGVPRREFTEARNQLNQWRGWFSRPENLGVRPPSSGRPMHQVMNGGPYVVSGGVPLKEIAPVQTLNGENVDWHVLPRDRRVARPLCALPVRSLQ